MMSATTDRTSNQNIAWIQDLGARRTDAVIFAHGKKCDGDFSIEGKNVTINFYIQDEALFTFSPVVEINPFEKLIRNKLAPLEIYNTQSKTKVPNYELNKAAGSHLTNKEAEIDYTGLQDIVNRSKYDIISIRYRKINFSQQNLENVVTEGRNKGYETFHCFFCRAKSDGKDTFGSKGAQDINGAKTTVYK